MRYLFSFYSDAARIALQSILAHKLRAFLTLIGIIIGVASVVVVGAAISGLNTYVVEKVSKVLGTNHFMIARMVSQGELSEEDLERMNHRNKQLKWADMEWLQQYCETCTAVGAEAGRGTKFEQNGMTFFGGIIFGVTANMAEIEDKTMTDGRFIQPEEVSHGKLVVVLGADIKDKFYPDIDPLGKEFKVAGLPMRVVGVEERRGPIFGDLIDKHVYIPLTTFQRLYGRNLDLQIHGKGQRRETFQLTIEDARRALRNYHELIGSEEDDFGLVNTEALGSQIDQFTGAIALVVTPITLIALVVGGIVVMNIMLVSVTERTFEIGLRKALGARRKQVLLQFLIESSMLCALGGVLGLLAAAGISWAVTVLTPITMTITIGYIVVAPILTGLRANIVKMVEEYGTNNIYAFHLTTGPQVGERDQSERARKPLTPEDAEAIAEQASAVEAMALESTNIGCGGCGFDDTIKINGRTYRRGNTQGVTANHADIHNASLKEGRVNSEQDDRNRRNVMVIGVNAAEALFPDQSGGIVGTRVRMGSYVWEIIGVLAKRQTTVFGENEEDNAVFVPFRTGVIGVLAAIGISKLVGFLIPILPASIPLWAVIAGLTVSVAIGLIFGVWPARKAARLDPIECLRYE